MLKLIFPTIFLFYFLASSNAIAQTFDEIFDSCLIEKIKTSDKNAKLKTIEDLCEIEVVKKHLGGQELGAMTERIIKEKKTAFNPYVITPHKMNYILPVTITDSINNNAYDGYSNWKEHLKNVESKFQLSIKVPLTTGSFITNGDQLFFGFTLESWWQVYTGDISRPFRETNYQPEIFYFTPTNWHPFNTNSALIFGFEHQSNGRSELLSRSWNRIYATFLFEKKNLAVSFRPWYRIPEGDKATTIDSVGDDNPDINDYMGYFELGVVYKLNRKYELSMKFRESFSKHNGAIELGITFPLWGKLRGYAQYFNGYGESLIDYNYKQQRLGIGFALTDIL
jgi:phospholipase A1